MKRKKRKKKKREREKVSKYSIMSSVYEYALITIPFGFKSLNIKLERLCFLLYLEGLIL